MATAITQAVGRAFDVAHHTAQSPAAPADMHNLLVQDSIAAQPTMQLIQLDSLDSLSQNSSRDGASQELLKIFLPLIIVMSTFLFLMLTFLCCILLLRRRRGIVLRDSDGPIDLSREDLLEGEGGFEGIESRWLESVSESERREYNRAKGMPAVSVFASSIICLPVPLS